MHITSGSNFYFPPLPKYNIEKSMFFSKSGKFLFTAACRSPILLRSNPFYSMFTNLKHLLVVSGVNFSSIYSAYERVILYCSPYMLSCHISTQLPGNVHIETQVTSIIIWLSTLRLLVAAGLFSNSFSISPK